MRLKSRFWNGNSFENKIVNVGGEGFFDFSHLYAFPCFVDTHAHVLSLGLKSQMVDLEKADLKEELSKKREKLIGRGWTDKPKLKLINSVDYPVALISKDGHSAVLNDRAKEILNFKENVIYEEDVDRVYDLFTISDFESALEIAQKEFFKVGVSEVHSDDMHGIGYEDLVKVLSKSKLRIYEKLFTKDPKPWMFKKISKRVEIKAIKLFADGSITSRTAYMKEPYIDTGERGIFSLDEVELERILKFGKENDVEICIHAIGDAAIERIAPLLEKYPGNRIIHAQFVPENVLEKLRKTRFSVQPHFYYEDLLLMGFVRTESLKYPFLEMYKMGFEVMFSSDAPVSPHDPRYVIEAALRMGFDLETALKLYTVGSKDWCFYEKPNIMENYPVLMVMDDGEIVEVGR